MGPVGVGWCRRVMVRRVETSAHLGKDRWMDLVEAKSATRACLCGVWANARKKRGAACASLLSVKRLQRQALGSAAMSRAASLDRPNANRSLCGVGATVGSGGLLGCIGERELD